MGCKTCKQNKKQKEKVVNDEKDTLDINFVPKSVREGGFENGSFVFKLIAFVVILISLPLVLSVLIIQMFLHFFLPKSLPKVTKKVRNFFKGLIYKYASFRHDREVRKRKKQFEKNSGYEEGSELVNVVDYDETEINEVEVHENNNDVKK